MAEAFEKFSKKVASVADTAKTKAKGIYDVAKLKIELGKKEFDLDECFEKLGRAYFIYIKKDNDSSGKVEELISKAEILSTEIYNLKKNIADVQGKKICDHCASIIDTDAPYCTNCGQKIVAEKKNEESCAEEESAE